jgi:hypothetical protein
VTPVVVTWVVGASGLAASLPQAGRSTVARVRRATARVPPVRDRRWLFLVAFPIVLGVVIRLVYLWGVHKTQCPAAWWNDPTAPRDLSGRCPGDSYVYHYGANLLADGKGLVIPTDFRQSGGLVARAGADHPPLFVIVLAAFSWVGARSWLWHEHVMILIGAVNIGLTGMLGRRLGGQWVGFVAAMLMAVYPYVWLSDTMVLSETLAMTLNLTVALLCYRLLRDHRWRWVVALGVAAGAAALVRAEMVLLGPVLILPLVLRIRGLALGRRAAMVAVAALAMVAVLAPWLYRNLTIYNNTVTMSTGTGITLVASNCDDTYYGGGMGFWSFRCYPVLPWQRSEAELRGTDVDTLALWVRQSGLTVPDGATPDQLTDILLAHGRVADQSDDELFDRNVAMDYISEHYDRLPVVAAARFGRMWNLYNPLQQLDLEDGEGRPTHAAAWGLGMFYPLMVAAIGGTVVLWRRKVAVLPLLAPIAIVSLSAVTAFGQSRYRTPAEPMLIVLASVGAVSLWQWARVRAARRRRDPAGAVEPSSAPLG